MSKTQPILLTVEGVAKIKSELRELKGPQRDALARRLREAIQMGDLSENADYHKAKEDQGFLEGRIQELEFTLRNATIVEGTSFPKDVVAIGVHVTVKVDGFEDEVFQMVGAQESDPRAGKISYESPIGRALIDHCVGETVEAETPGGKIRLVIIKIE
jgi:transcription elongation factor GreA